MFSVFIRYNMCVCVCVCFILSCSLSCVFWQFRFVLFFRINVLDLGQILIQIWSLVSVATFGWPTSFYFVLLNLRNGVYVHFRSAFESCCTETVCFNWNVLSISQPHQRQYNAPMTSFPWVTYNLNAFRTRTKNPVNQTDCIGHSWIKTIVLFCCCCCYFFHLLV